MKFNKIIALSICALMSFSTIANAGYTQDEDDWYIADKVTAAQVAARTPKAVIDVTELTAAEAQTAGLAMGKGATKLDDTNSDFYQIELTLSDLGDLMYAYLNGSDYANEMQVRLYNANVTLPGVVFKKVTTTSTFESIAWQTSDPGNEDNLFSMYWNAGSATDCYPKRIPTTGDLTGAYITNASLPKATFVIAVNDGTNVTVTPTLKITYNVVNDSESAEPNATAGVFPNGSVTIAHASAPTLALEVTGAGANNGVFPNGYIWTANVTKGTASVTAFDILFEAGAESLPKSINNLEVLNGWLGSGSAEFQIGLKTTKTLTGATFTVTDDDSASDAVDWVPSV